MEQNSTNGRNQNSVPNDNLGKPAWENELDDLFRMVDDPFRDNSEVFSSAKTAFASGEEAMRKARIQMQESQKRFDAIMEKERVRIGHLMRSAREDVQRNLNEASARLEEAKKNTTFREYEENGYHVSESVSKDGTKVLMKTRKRNDGYDHKVEIYQGGKLKFTSTETSYSYVDQSGKFVTVEKRPVARRLETTYSSGTSTVRKKAKKKSHAGVWLLLGIAVVVLYFMFLR